MGSRFYVRPVFLPRFTVANSIPQFGGSDDSGSEFDGNDSSLPFPKPLARSAFLGPDFDPTTFLANLSDRYQTLEDLRNELRELSQSLSKELLDLVNDNYQDFLSLGSTLRGGEERAEEVRVSLLGFQRDLTSVRDNVKRRQESVATLINEKRKLMKHIQSGKSLLEISEQIEDLEASLMISTATDGSLEGTKGQAQDFSDESDGDDAAEGGISMSRLERHVNQYLILRLLLQRHPPTQPYISSQSDRITRIRSTLSLDLEGALKYFRSVQKGQQPDHARIDRLRELLVSVNQSSQCKLDNDDFMQGAQLGETK
jgi:conserved oligomeric Golgi complex subunit 2